MGLFRSLSGSVHIELVSADIPGLLSQISGNNISATNLQSVDEMTVHANILREDYKRLCTITEHRGDKLNVIRKEGIYWKSKDLVQRSVLLTALSLLLLFALVLPSRILFVRVQGNSLVPSKLIIDTADECGISFFASRRKVRSEKVKNALVEKIPELQWVGVNTAGCVATINVTEKTVSKQPEETSGRVSSIVASRDGVIGSLTVKHGNQLCQVGQAVKAGQTLVSGYTDCGIMIKATRSDAEIYAQTFRELQVVAPVIAKKRDTYTDQKKKFSIIFGKKLIKLYNDSGISDTTCVKIYDEIKITLPGGFQLPVSLIRETVKEYDFSAAEQTDDFNWLEENAIRYLQSQMIAGRILDQDIKMQLQDDICSLHGQFACYEMIAQEKVEEIIQR